LTWQPVDWHGTADALAGADVVGVVVVGAGWPLGGLDPQAASPSSRTAPATAGIARIGHPPYPGLYECSFQ
jgi:hypothetical protein